jgi:hypothetical protein
MKYRIVTKQVVLVEGHIKDRRKVESWMKANCVAMKDWIEDSDTGETTFVGERTLGQIEHEDPKTPRHLPKRKRRGGRGAGPAGPKHGSNP